MNNTSTVFDNLCSGLRILACVFASWTSFAEAGDPGDHGSLVALEQSLETIMSDNNIPGLLGVVVTKDNIVWEGRLGVVDVTTQSSVDASTLFRVGSITKSLTSLAIMRAVEDGKISLEMDIETELPEVGVSNPWRKESPVLLVNVLEHTAGFDDVHPRDYALNDPDITLLDAIRFNNGSRVARWRPGTRMSYSNIGPAIGALALEKSTGEDFDDYVQREIFDALGMRTATLHYDPAVSKSYNSDGSEAPYIHIGLRPSGSAAFSTADMVAFVQMFLNRGEVAGRVFTSPEIVERMETPTSTLSAKLGMKAGYGLGSVVTLRDGFIYHGHNGGIDGFLSVYAYLPSHDVGFFFSINSSNAKAFADIETVLHRFITRNLRPGDIPERVPLSHDEADSIAGIYKPVSPRIQLMQGLDPFVGTQLVRVSGDKVLMSNLLQQSETQEWYSVGGNMYRQAGQVLPYLTLLEGDGGEKLLQGYSGTFQKVSVLSALFHWLCAIVAVLLMLGCWLYAPIWSIQMARGRFDGRRDHLLHILPLLTTIHIPVCVFALMQALSDISRIHLQTSAALIYWIGSVQFGIFSALSVGYICLQWKRRVIIGRASWLYALTNSSFMLLVFLYCAYHGLVGLRLWAY